MMWGRNTRSVRWKSAIGTGMIVVFLFVIFVVSIRWFRSQSQKEKPFVASIAEVLKPDPISQAVIDTAIDTQSRDAILKWVATGERVGTAVRGEKDGRYYIEMKATLPTIDREVYYYQVWLLQRLPYDFFSLGEMVTDEEGYFILEWEALDDQDYFGYTHLVITVNEYGGSPDPGEHLVEGVFGD